MSKDHIVEYKKACMEVNNIIDSGGYAIIPDYDIWIKMFKNSTTFYEYIKSQGLIDCELIFAGCDMNYSFVWDNEDTCFTTYGEEYYKPILSANYKVLPNGNIEVFCDDLNLANDFVKTLAGYTPESRYNKLIQEF